mgnify:CR=1 FL=1
MWPPYDCLHAGAEDVARSKGCDRTVMLACGWWLSSPSLMERRRCMGLLLALESCAHRGIVVAHSRLHTGRSARTDGKAGHGRQGDEAGNEARRSEHHVLGPGRIGRVSTDFDLQDFRIDELDMYG